jgi:hypothetical protein
MGQRNEETSYAFKTCQKIAVNSTAATLSSQANDYINVYRIVASADVWGEWGSSTVTAQSSAGTDSVFFPAYVPEYISTNKRYFSFISETSTSAFVNLCEGTQGD